LLGGHLVRIALRILLVGIRAQILGSLLARTQILRELFACRRVFF
jgi:hypothetical protein